MKMVFKKFSFSVVAALFLLVSACSTKGPAQEEDSNVEGDVKITRIEATSPDADKFVASLAIDGMACEMMCGNKISGTLAGLEGVVGTEIEFLGAEEENIVLVEFDAEKISEKEMIEAVESLANGHYKVNAVKTTHYKKIAGTPEENDKVSSSYSPKLQYQLPNVFGVLASLF